MEEITAGLHATPAIDLGFGRPPLLARSYLVQRPGGNFTIYGASPLLPELDEIDDLGGADRQYLNHAHEASAEAAIIKERLGAPLHVHMGDRAETQRQVPIDAVFADRHTVGEDFEVIPIPGHTPGATAFLWRGPEARVLFTGDSVFVRDAQWGAAFLDFSSERTTYVASLELMAELEFDLLAPGVTPVGQPFVFHTNPEDSRRRLLEIAERLRAGHDR